MCAGSTSKLPCSACHAETFLNNVSGKVGNIQKLFSSFANGCEGRRCVSCKFDKWWSHERQLVKITFVALYLVHSHVLLCQLVL